MSPLVKRIKKLREELEKYFETKEPKMYDLYTNSKRFINAIKSLDNNQLIDSISNIDLETQEGFNNIESDFACIFLSMFL